MQCPISDQHAPFSHNTSGQTQIDNNCAIDAYSIAVAHQKFN